MTSKLNILFVEDDDDLRVTIVEWLAQEGAQVTEARNAAEFYQAIHHNEFQISLIDVNLPDQEGYVLAEYVKNNCQMGIILLTARDSLEDKLQGYRCGADNYLIKPIDCRELSAVISSVAVRINKSPQEASIAKRHWEIYPKEWMLYSPEKGGISLSLKELMLLELLACRDGAPRKKNDILTKLYNRVDHYSNRSLDSLVRRLRAKVQSHTGLEIPIRTIHSVGYSFAGDLLRKGD